MNLQEDFLAKAETMSNQAQKKGNIGRKERISIDSDTKKRLHHAIWICKFRGLSETDSMNYINGGVLGYQKKGKKSIPIDISLKTFYRYKKELETPENQMQTLYETANSGLIEELNQTQNMFAEWQAMSQQNLLDEKDPSKRQSIIDSMFKNSLYPLNLADLIKNVMEKKVLEKPTKNKEIFTV